MTGARLNELRAAFRTDHPELYAEPSVKPITISGLSIAADPDRDLLVVNEVKISGSLLRPFLAGKVGSLHVEVRKEADLIHFTTLPCERQLPAIRAAAEAYAVALRNREHGAVAAARLADAVLEALGIDWRNEPRPWR